MGVEVKDAAGNLKQLDVILPEIANKFKLLENGTTKAALAQELFGKGGLEMIEFLNLGSEGLDEMAAKARELGIVISEETAAAADQFNDKLADLRATADGLALELAAGLLPSLNLTAERFQELVKGGDLARNAISLFSGILSAGVSILEEYNNVVARTSIAMEFLLSDVRDLPEAYKNAQFRLDQLTAAQARSAAIAANNANLPDNFSSGSRRRGGATAADIEETKASTNAAKERLAIEQRLAAVMGGSGAKAKKKSGGKSDAEKEAEQLKAAYDRLNASMAEQIALFGKTSEVAKVRYDLENTELAKLSSAQKESLIAQAEKIDAMRLEKELQDAANKASEEKSKIIREGIKATDQVISDMEFELELLGKTNIERAKAIELRNLDANATDEQRAAVGRLTEELIRASENQQFLDDFKEGLADAFTDFITGAKSAKEAFGDFADELFKRATQFVMDKAIEAMFSAFSGGTKTQGGQTGGGFDWMSLLSLFGGGKASGGAVNAGMFYRVNENGPELLTSGGKDYLMMGNQSGTVTPNSGMGGLVVNNQFIVGPQNNQRTQEQMATRTALALSEAQRRNS